MMLEELMSLHCNSLMLFSPLLEEVLTGIQGLGTSHSA